MRKKVGIGQKELASLAKVSQSLIAKVENGKVEPSYSIARRIFTILEKLEHKQDKKCKDIMTRKVIFVKKDDKIKKASELLKENSIDQLPVLDNSKAVGSISESDIFNKLVEIEKRRLFEMKVSEIMNEPFPIVNLNMPISLVAPMLKSEPAILVTENNKIRGIITKFNLI